ncbi:hypothetical protein MTO96_018090 [Rhipicephalus appendiculatus]
MPSARRRDEIETSGRVRATVIASVTGPTNTYTREYRNTPNSLSLSPLSCYHKAKHDAALRTQLWHIGFMLFLSRAHMSADVQRRSPSDRTRPHKEAINLRGPETSAASQTAASGRATLPPDGDTLRGTPRAPRRMQTLSRARVPFASLDEQQYVTDGNHDLAAGGGSNPPAAAAICYTLPVVTQETRTLAGL